MCFADLRKACGSVDRELRWKALARAGLPDEMITLLSANSTTDMLDRVRVHDGLFPDWSEATQLGASTTGRTITTTC